MKNNIARFLIKLLIFTVLILGLSYLLSFLLPQKWLTPVLLYLVLFFSIITAVVYIVIKKATEKRFNRFVLLFNLSTFIKLIIYVGAVMIYVFLFKEDAVPFLAAFFILYLLFTVFEIAMLLRSERK